MEDLFPTQQIPETLEINNCTNGERTNCKKNYISDEFKMTPMFNWTS